MPSGVMMHMTGRERERRPLGSSGLSSGSGTSCKGIVCVGLSEAFVVKESEPIKATKMIKVRLMNFFMNLIVDLSAKLVSILESRNFLMTEK